MKQLRFTTTKPMPMGGIFNPEEDHKPLATPSNVGGLIGAELKASSAYIHGNAEALAKFDIPTFIDGDMKQLDEPVENQDILMILPSGEYPCKAEIVQNKYNGGKMQYHITLKD